MATARLRALGVIATAALGIATMAGDANSNAPGCPNSVGPEMAPSLVDLHRALGDVMGSPSRCPLVDGGGNTIQLTTTGIAVYLPSGVSTFVSGDQHWALTAGGLETWNGNWHNGLYPPPNPPPDHAQPEPAQPAPASIEPMTLVQVPEDMPDTVVVEDPRGRIFTVEIASGCPDVAAALGDHVFLRSGAPHTDLILVPQRETCAVTDMQPAEAD